MCILTEDWDVYEGARPTRYEGVSGARPVYGFPRAHLPRRRVNKGKMENRSVAAPVAEAIFSQVAELASFEPVQHQLEGARLDASAPREGMVQDADGEQHKRNHPRQRRHHQRV